MVAVGPPLMGAEPGVVVLVGGQGQGDDSEASHPNEWFPPTGRVEEVIRRGLLKLEGGMKWDLKLLFLECSTIPKAVEPAIQSRPKSLILKIPLFSASSSLSVWSPLFYWERVYFIPEVFSALCTLIKLYMGQITGFLVLFLVWKYATNFLSYF